MLIQYQLIYQYQLWHKPTLLQISGLLALRLPKLRILRAPGLLTARELFVRVQVPILQRGSLQGASLHLNPTPNH
jgi:hypothetical protein